VLNGDLNNDKGNKKSVEDNPDTFPNVKAPDIEDASLLGELLKDNDGNVTEGGNKEETTPSSDILDGLFPFVTEEAGAGKQEGIVGIAVDLEKYLQGSQNNDKPAYN
jgi:hypothetical protein